LYTFESGLREAFDLKAQSSGFNVLAIPYRYSKSPYLLDSIDLEGTTPWLDDEKHLSLGISILGL
jgi:hypothetical protein